MGRVIYTGGSFDQLHAGHLQLLAACRGLAGSDGRVVVALNTDEFIEQYKGRPPLVPFRERAELLEACRLVDVVVCNVGGPDSRTAINVVMPDLIAIGDDWKDRDYYGQMGFDQDWLDARYLRVVYVPRTRGVSSSARRQAAAAR